MTDQRPVIGPGALGAATGPKSVNIDAADLDDVTEKQLLWNVYRQLRTLVLLVAVLVVVTLVAVGVSAWLTVDAINDVGTSGF